MADKRRALGRGLSALIADFPSPSASQPPPAGPLEVDLDLIEPNRDQPRRDIDESRLESLAASISETGVLQPIVVRRREEGSYEIVAGERRWRAAQRAGLLKVPVVVRDVPADKRLELALIENVQRENLNPVEEARAYRRLADELGRTQDQIAQAVGKERATVANYLRLLTLPDDVLADIASGALTMGHARALAALPAAAAQRQAAREVRAGGLSVRATEALVKKRLEPPPPRQPPPPDVHTRAAADSLRVALGSRVEIVRRRRGGEIRIAFGSEDELQRLFERLSAR
ncbi:MAG: ParB/RepB/Spo0J family partition protein [Acidobacteria bacterium]|nr:ParB/RepB/Spo0J family partition protein [Acidobacteriota bacterium]